MTNLHSDSEARQATTVSLSDEPVSLSQTNDLKENEAPNDRLPPFIRLLRPHQWTKNLTCLAGLFFSGNLTNFEAIGLSILTVFTFSMAASAMYIFNDLQDCERDRQHPKKRFRPIASGKVKRRTAMIATTFLASVALVIASKLGLGVLICLASYVVINFSYSLKLKHLALFDVCCIALGFVMRLLSGIYAIHEDATGWITLCTFFLALLLGLSKRRAELFEMSKSTHSSQQRPVLSQYTIPYLDSLIGSTATMTVICYALFTVTHGQNPSLVITVPIVYYAVMHYQQLVMVRKGGEEPDRILLKDNRIKYSILLWLICYAAIFYGNISLFS